MKVSRGAPERPLAWPLVPDLPALRVGDRVHLVGIGGAGMSGLARALVARGLLVSGSDRTPSEELDELRREGVAVAVGHRADQLPSGCALVVRSPAIPDDNPEILAAQQLGVPVAKRAALLGALMDETVAVAVAGTHGKSTTSGLIAWCLTIAGRDPSYFIGGLAHDLGSNANLGSGDTSVIEADEYDRSFLHGHPTIGVVTHIEHDHPDIYPDLESVLEAFRLFVGRIRPAGCLIANLGSPNVVDCLTAAAAPVEGYYVVGDPEPRSGLQPLWRAEPLPSVAGRQEFLVWHGTGSLGRWSLRLPGRHNIANGLAAIAVAERLGVPRAASQRALAEYRGLERRFQVVGDVLGVTVIDDYAHHPTEIRATLAAARERYPGRRLVAVLQPHTYSRVAAMAADFAAALAAADRTILTPVYAAREAPIAEGTAEQIAAHLPTVAQVASLPQAADLVAAEAHPGDVALFLGAGDLPLASHRLLQILRQRAYHRLLTAAAAENLPANVQRDASLAAYTTLRLGGPADLLIPLDTLTALVAWWRLVHRHGVPARILGSGSNVVAGDAGYRGVVLLNRCRSWSLEPAGADKALVVAESGVPLAGLAHALADEGWSGLEAATGIPGTVGAATVMNAGAYDWSMADSLRWVEMVEPTGTVQRLEAADLELGYRTSRLRGDHSRAVTRLALEVRRDDPTRIAARIAQATARRRSSQPAQSSAGSVFRNPAGDYAGRLLEAAGLKGQRRGGIAISTRHANFFVNEGQGTARDFAALVRLARGTVLAQFGVWLELEIEPLGGNGVA